MTVKEFIEIGIKLFSEISCYPSKAGDDWYCITKDNYQRILNESPTEQNFFHTFKAEFVYYEIYGILIEGQAHILKVNLSADMRVQLYNFVYGENPQSYIAALNRIGYFQQSCETCPCYNDYLVTGWCQVLPDVKRKIYSGYKEAADAKLYRNIHGI